MAKESPDTLILNHPPSHAVFQPCGPVAVMSPFPSLFTGLGYCFTFLPTVTLLAQYFSKRRALVTSIASSGESFALFAFAPGEYNYINLLHIVL